MDYVGGEPRPWAWVLYVWAAMVGATGLYFAVSLLPAVASAFRGSC